jgi:hypothetical protein
METDFLVDSEMDQARHGGSRPFVITEITQTV